MKILFAGTPLNAAEILDFLVKSGHHVVASLTKEDSIQNRSRDIVESEVAKKSSELSIPVIKANRVTGSVIEIIKSYQPDLAIVVAYGSLLSQEALSCLRIGWFNIHYSLLPELRGAAPVQHALLNGSNETGVTLFKIDQGMDSGPILDSVRTQINPDENSKELLHRLTELSKTLLSQDLPKIYAGIAKEIEQTGRPSLAPKITRAEARIRLDETAQQVHNKIRAMNPEPIAWLEYGGESFRILESRLKQGAQLGQPGEIVRGEYPLLICADGNAVELVEVQPAGKKVMSGADWLRGQRDLGRIS